jgi:peptidoglycan/LPS O-acetylase OafA/YrhL
MRYPTNLHAQRDLNEVFYHPELDVLRFFAFLAVFFHHAIPGEPSSYMRAGFWPAVAPWLVAAKEAGAYGVDLFFVLSSYLITELLLREHARRGTFSISAFYVRRALRIWPLYFTFLAATIFIIPTIIPSERFGPIYIVSFLLFFGNWVCAIYGLPFSVANPLWSISVEEQFYLGWPLALALFGINRIKLLAMLLLAVALVTRGVMAAGGWEHPAVWCNTLARLDAIALGALLAVLLRGRALEMRNTLRVLLAGVAVLSFLLVGRYLKQAGPTSVLTYLVTASASVLLLVSVLKSKVPFLSIWPFSYLVYLGRISYGLYVFHLLALTLVTKYLVSLRGGPISFQARIIFSFLLTVLLAAASYRWLEQPFLRLKKRFSYTSTGERDVWVAAPSPIRVHELQPDFSRKDAKAES